MPTHHTRRRAIGSLATFVALALGAHPVAADDRTELGIFLGGHVFSKNNEIGADEVPDADSPKNAFLGGVRLGYRVHELVNVEGEIAVMPTEARMGDADITAFGFRLHAVAHLTKPDATWRPFGLVGTSWMIGSSTDDRVLDDDTDWIGLHAGAGVKYRIDAQTGVRADARIFLPPSSEGDAFTTDFVVTVGLYRTFGAKAAPPPAPAPAPTDADGDGIVDADDKCVNDPEDKDGFEDTDGCPDGDNDGDGIADADDQCRDEAEDKDGIVDEDGCPEDNADGDKLPDVSDKCPLEAEDYDQLEDDDGCPEDDVDGDGIADNIDQCPPEPETRNGYEDDDGCPDEVPAAVAKFTGTIKGIRFQTGKAKILRASNRTLDEAVGVLTEYSTLRLEIQGHTDDVGDDATNKTLSQARADAVKAYFVAKGIDEARLVAIGHGEEKPIADNKNSKGRALNRRVEFQLIQ
jgi:OOP family OmpA-OmpF porin